MHNQNGSPDLFMQQNNRENLPRHHLNSLSSTVPSRRHLIKEIRKAKREYRGLERELKAACRMKCPFCHHSIQKSRVVYLAECGHGACKGCLVQSVVNSALQLNRYYDVETINDSFWKCCQCGTDNHFFACFHGDLLQVKDVTRRTELGEEVKKRYREQLQVAGVGVVDPLPHELQLTQVHEE